MKHLTKHIENQNAIMQSESQRLFAQQYEGLYKSTALRYRFVQMFRYFRENALMVV